MNIRWIDRVISHFARRPPKSSPDPGRLMSQSEKAELEAIIEKQLQAFYAEHGGHPLVEPGWAVSLSAEGGPRITREPPEQDQLARIEFQSLLSIRSLLATELPHITVSRNMLPNLATEVTRELAHQVNRMAAEISGNTAETRLPGSEQVRRAE